MTTSSTARIRCDNPQRLARSLVSRFDGEAETEWNGEEGRGHLVFRWGSGADVDMVAGDGVLLIHLEGRGEDLDRLEAMIAAGVGDGDVAWKRAGGDRG